MKTTNAILLFSCVPNAWSARFETSTDHTALLQSQVRTSASTEYQAATELFPSLTSLSDPKSNRAALAQIERAVTSMSADRSQITDGVAGIVSGVIDMLDLLITHNQTNGEYEGEILKEHDVDQKNLDAKVNDVNVVLHGDAVLNDTNVQLTVNCHINSTDICHDVSVCTGEVRDATNGKEIANANLDEIDKEIDAYWCDEKHIINDTEHNLERTVPRFREHSSVLFAAYNEALDIWNSTDDDVDELVQVCQINQEKYTAHLTLCSHYETSALANQCAEYGKMQGHLQNYINSRESFEESFWVDRVATMLREADRKVEYEVVTRVICLLGTLTNRSGSLMRDGDVAGETNMNDIQDCKDKFVSTVHLNIAYPVQPGLPELPLMPVYPCDSSFETSLGATGDCGYSISPPVIIEDLETLQGNLAVNATEYYAGVDVACTCETVETPPTWTDNLPHFALVDALVDHSNLNVDATTSTWSYFQQHSPGGSDTVRAYNGVVSECSTCTDRSRCDPSGELYGGLATSVCHLYASEQAIIDAPPSESIEEFAMSHGGFVYKDDAGNVLGFRTWAPIVGNLAQQPSHLLAFGPPQHDAAAKPCGAAGFQACSADICPVGPSRFCWVPDGVRMLWPDATQTLYELDHQMGGQTGGPAVEAPPYVIEDAPPPEENGPPAVGDEPLMD